MKTLLSITLALLALLAMPAIAQVELYRVFYDAVGTSTTGTNIPNRVTQVVPVSSFDAASNPAATNELRVPGNYTWPDYKCGTYVDELDGTTNDLRCLRPTKYLKLTANQQNVRSMTGDERGVVDWEEALAWSADNQKPERVLRYEARVTNTIYQTVGWEWEAPYGPVQVGNLPGKAVTEASQAKNAFRSAKNAYRIALQDGTNTQAELNVMIRDALNTQHDHNEITGLPDMVDWLVDQGSDLGADHFGRQVVAGDAP